MIRIRVEGLDKVVNNLNKFGNDLPRYVSGAGKEASNVILRTEGVQKYPPATQANTPPPPYYIRGRGMQTSKTRNDLRSQKLGTRWSVEQYKGLGIVIKNPVTYAEYVHGKRQARWMARIGWKKVYDVAKEKTKEIEDVYNRWIQRLLRKYGL